MCSDGCIELFQFNLLCRLFCEAKRKSLIWKQWDILGHMVWMLCISTSIVVWITPWSPNMSWIPSGRASLISFHYGCRKLKPGFLFQLLVLCMTIVLRVKLSLLRIALIALIGGQNFEVFYEPENRHLSFLKFRGLNFGLMSMCWDLVVLLWLFTYHAFIWKINPNS